MVILLDAAPACSVFVGARLCTENVDSSTVFYVMVCTLKTSGFWQTWPILTIEIVVIYLLITRFSVRLVVSLVSSFGIIFTFAYYKKYTTNKRYDFEHRYTQIVSSRGNDNDKNGNNKKKKNNDQAVPAYQIEMNEKFIEWPTAAAQITATAEHPSLINNDTIYAFRINKQSNVSQYCQLDDYSFAMIQDFVQNGKNKDALSSPHKELSLNAFIKIWQNGEIVPYTIDSYDLSIWCIYIDDKSSFYSKLIKNKRNYTMTCREQLLLNQNTSNNNNNINNENSSDKENEVVFEKNEKYLYLFRVSYKLFLQMNKQLKKSRDSYITDLAAKNRLTLIYDSDNRLGGCGDHLGYLMQICCNGKKNSNENCQFISNHSGFTGLQFRFVQLRRTKHKNPLIEQEYNQFKMKFLMLFHYYFIFYYNTMQRVLLFNDNKNTFRLIMEMRSNDIFWMDYMKPSLPGIKQIFVYQSIFKSIQGIINEYHNRDGIAYFLSYFALDDLYIRYCTPKRFFYMLQETCNKFSEFHSDFIYFKYNSNIDKPMTMTMEQEFSMYQEKFKNSNSGDNGDNSDNSDNSKENEKQGVDYTMDEIKQDMEFTLNLETREQAVGDRDIIIDIGCEILGNLIYAMNIVSKNNSKCFYVARYENDICCDIESDDENEDIDDENGNNTSQTGTNLENFGNFLKSIGWDGIITQEDLINVKVMSLFLILFYFCFILVVCFFHVSNHVLSQIGCIVGNDGEYEM